MNENLNLVEILKDCPIGWHFYSSVYGEVEFIGVLHDYPTPLHGREDDWCFYSTKKHKYPIKLMAHSGEYFVSREGKHVYSAGECTLFPSKDQRDWSKFEAPWYKKEKFDPKTLQPFDKVLLRDTHSKPWRCSLFSHIETDRHLFPYATCGGNYSFCIPFNDDTKHLVGTKDEAPEYYRYWED